uniref:EF-hand domain-containing protein n=1 Tax=Chromera velia CCMP2878 TaxID=1169474 RepID=A0A0G4FI08_9ALVE|mmetsp:Transcript_34692/g.68509  ORF Transcript_34692/g.68509 Transcript_34692/m.68509 type:complete len:323 (+) Transcript_34692:284-1252(+)|eukprot:Cvel_17052.t1-p1 / transcript=Cvel_17052.t1 / gene=Cvel_17052 / organism=Chromera_velia_CCMP2878 / gene_product=Calumenin, putative / transcript_product=Calumenin, putative / location=Cvel_scaffold1343:6206-9512(-) / protein_length=322 / sequence_SO=supercontig / SO=protein_coding / is_pseudo=false
MSRLLLLLLLLFHVLFCVSFVRAQQTDDDEYVDDTEDYFEDEDDEYDGGDFDDEEDFEKLAEALGMTSDEMGVKISKIFEYIDRDKDGIATTDEILAFIEWTHDTMKEKQKLQDFETIDTSGDGKIDKEEMIESYFGDDGADESERERARPSLVKRFDAADRNKDGFLDAEEMMVLMHPQKHDDMMRIEIDEIMESKDTDKDGKISKDEFLEGVDEEERQEIEDEFDQLDTDGSGFIEVEEVKTVIMESMKGPEEKREDMEAEIEKWVEMNGGGILKDDFPRRASVLVATSITDYGEILRFPETYGLDLGDGGDGGGGHDEL